MYKFVILTIYFKIRNRRRAVGIKGSVCVISGASQGIGACVAERLSAAGAKKVVLVARTESKLNAVREKINKKYPDVAVSFPIDCSDYSQVENMAQQVKEQFGVPQILVNCAGAGAWRYLWEMEAKEIVGCMNGMFVSPQNSYTEKTKF